MSQQSVHFDSFLHSNKRFGQTAKSSYDPLFPKSHISIVAPIYPIKRELSSRDTVAFGNEVTFKLPSSGFVHNLSLKTLLAQTTTENYSDYPGLSIIDEVHFVSENETLHQYKYNPTIQYFMSMMNNEECVDKLLLAAGGTNVGTAADVYVLSPIPTFFDGLLVKGASPLNLSKFKKAPELRIKLRTLANSVKPTSTGGSITSMKLVLYMTETTSTLKNLHNSKISYHNSIDFSTNVLNNATTATALDIDVTGIKGNVKRLFLTQRSVANVGTNKQYFVNTEIGSIKTVLDGHEEFVFQQKEEAEYDYLIYNQGKGFNSTLGYPYVIPYSYFPVKDYQQHHIGGIHSAKLGKHEIKVTQSTGANQYIDVLGIRSAIYKYTNGGMVRLI